MKHWLRTPEIACGTEIPFPSPLVCTDEGRKYCDAITKFSRLDGLPILLTNGALLACFVCWSPAMIKHGDWEERQKFTYLTMKNSRFVRFTRASCCRSRPFDDVEWPVLPLCGQREHLTTKFCLISELQDADSAMLRTHFTGTMTWNNSKIIAEKRSYISDDTLVVGDVVFV